MLFREKPDISELPTEHLEGSFTLGMPVLVCVAPGFTLSSALLVCLFKVV